MGAGLKQSENMLSPLAKDLVLSRINLAVLKAKSKSPSQEEREWANMLSHTFKKELALLQGCSISDTLIRDSKMRHELEETMATLPHIRSKQESSNPVLLEKLTVLLQEFANTGLSEDKINELFSALLEVGEQRQKKIETQNFKVPEALEHE